VSIEITPTPDLYCIEFKFPRPHLGISVVLPATCELAAKLVAWRLFPEHKRNAVATFVCHARYVEIDWQTGRSIVMTQKKRPAVPFLKSKESETPGIEKKQDEEGAQ
jgi:hypothetical protein